jgi:[acyl-carrier-protein] S-malonyltransferase
MNNILANGVRTIVEVGPGTVLQGLFKKVDRNLDLSSATV